MNFRLLAGYASLLAVMFAASGDLSACGDKFLRFGRSARAKTYAAIHPASILVYVPATTTPKALKDFETALKRAGHRPQPVHTMEAAVAALGADSYDIVIASEQDVARLRNYAASARSKPLLVPILLKPTKASLAEIGREYPHVLKAGAAKHDHLAEIDCAMKARLSAQP